MSTPPQAEPLLWQYADNRKPAQFIAMRVKDIRKEGGGLFGIGNSPSIAHSMPDARLIEGGRIDAGGPAVKLRAPAGELPKSLNKGSRAVLGLVDARHVICMLLPPETVDDAALLTWAAGQPCGR